MLTLKKMIKKVVNGETVEVPNEIKNLRVRYNDVTKHLNPGDELDVRDMGVQHTHIKEVEAHIIKKNPGLFDQEERLTDSVSVKAADKKIKELTAALEKERKANETLTKDYAEVQTKVVSLIDEQTGFGQQIENLKAEVSRLKAELKRKDQPDAKKK